MTLTIGILLLLVGLPARAQAPFAGAPLVGPLLATTPASRDRVVLYDLGGGTERSFTLGAQEHTVWGFSPDGCRLLLTLAAPGGLAQIVTTRLDGTDLQSLIRYDEMPPGAWGAWEPDWSPDGSRIAFTMVRDTAYLNLPAPQADGDPYEYRVAWVPPEGGVPTFYSISGDEHTPHWSPDGAWLAYTAYEARVPGADPASTAIPTPEAAGSSALPTIREADLWVVSADAEEKYRLTYFDTGSVGMPRWSPDGTLIGFVYAPVGNNDQLWMIANQPGSIPTQLSFQWSLLLDLTWLPDGSAMLAAARDFGNETINRLWRMPLIPPVENGASLYVGDPALSYVDFPRFSPDGTRLALRSAYALALVDPAAGTWSLLDEDTPGNTPPVWSPAAFGGEQTCR
jgi:Tol biopolymer transport system component